MYRENYKKALEAELIEMVAKELTPLALRYSYSETALETNIPWKPVVLITGNYSSGKSTMINEFLGADIQKTGQAPTDDSFTVLTFKGEVDEPVLVVEEHDGRYLMNDPGYPFEKFKKYGQRFASHLCLKEVNSPFLKELAIIDTPGMLDSISEKDRGYDYQAVIGELAEFADLILVLFDPHKAGTVRETYITLRETLPAKTYEERVRFVLNRIDECSSMADLIKVYGTLCWNLSQMTGRKDIPPIHLAWSGINSIDEENSDYLKYLENEREALKDSILKAPEFRLDHLATFAENHAENLSHLLEALIAYGARRRKFNLVFYLTALLLFFISSSATLLGIELAGGALGVLTVELQGLASGVFILVHILAGTVLKRFFYKRFYKKQLSEIDTLTPVSDQRRSDSWNAVKKGVMLVLTGNMGHFSLRRVKKDYDISERVLKEGTVEIREALKELSLIPNDQPDD